MIFRNRFGILFILGLVFLACSFGIRTVLFVKTGITIDRAPLLVLKIFGTGLVFDIVTFSYLAAPLALYLTVAPVHFFNTRWHRAAFQALTLIFIFVLLFDAIAEYLFFEEFGTRFNFIAVDYLIYTREVLGNIRESYPLGRILTGILLAAATLFLALQRSVASSSCAKDGSVQRYSYGAVLILLPILSFGLVDTSLTNISSNRYANELAGNGIYDLFEAFRNSELDFQKFYLTGENDALLARLRNLVREKNNRLASDDIRDITRVITNPGPEKRLNVIVIVEESLSAEYLGAFGSRRGLTPNLDGISKKSQLFTHLYAAGTRTVRGLEAITLSLPPLPGTSLIKRPNNENIFSWGSLMREKGYDTKFLYGGYGYFDNMNYFFSHNGFDIVDRSDFAKGETSFSNAWGVCDEDLFRKVIREAGRSYGSGRPFFSMVMTTSNHRPFTYPAGKIDIPPGAGREGGVKYADYAIGRFIEDAKRQPWFNNTLFVIVADHCAGSAGKTALPVKRYEIPLIIYSPSHLKPERIDKLASQIDVAPTILGLLNFSYQTKFFGKDILKMDATQERAFLSTYQILGLIEGDTLVVLSPQKRVKTYALKRTDGSIKEIPPSEQTVNDALAYYQGIDYLYRNGMNRFP